MNKNQNGFSVVETIIAVVVIGIVGVGGWLVWDKHQTRVEEKRMAQEALQAREAKAKEVASYPKARWTYSATEGAAAKKFMQKYNNAALSREICSSDPVNMFDIHITDYQTVFRYKCHNSIKTWIAIFEKSPESPEDSQLKASNLDDGKLYSWAYDNDADFYKNIYGVIRVAN